MLTWEKVVSGDTLLDYDALVLLFPRFTGESVPSDGKLSLVAVLELGMTQWIRRFAMKTGSY